MWQWCLMCKFLHRSSRVICSEVILHFTNLLSTREKFVNLNLIRLTVFLSLLCRLSGLKLPWTAEIRHFQPSIAPFSFMDAWHLCHHLNMTKKMHVYGCARAGLTLNCFYDCGGTYLSYKGRQGAQKWAKFSCYCHWGSGWLVRIQSYQRRTKTW